MSQDPNNKIIWAPQAGAQVRFLQCPVFEVLLEGTRGGGKTDALIMDFAQFVGRGFGSSWRGILFRQEHPQLKDVIDRSKKWFAQMWPEDSSNWARFNNTYSYWEWSSGEKLYLSHMSKKGDYWKHHGHEYPWIGWEELCNWPTQDCYKLMMSCCRSSHPSVPRHYRATTNPSGPGHNWVKQRFQLPGMREQIIWNALDDEGQPEKPRVAIFSPIEENKILAVAEPEYAMTIRSSAPNEGTLHAWLTGSWDIVSGGMFNDLWDSKVHVVEPFKIPSSWRIDRSFDWGSASPFSVGWWAESDGTDYITKSGRRRSTVRGDIFRIAEWYGTDGKGKGLQLVASQIAKGIVEREIAMNIRGRVMSGPADTSIFDVKEGRSIASEMARTIRMPDGRKERGVMWMRADKARKVGWEQVRDRLRNTKPELNSEGFPLPRELPGIFVFSSCMHFINIFPNLPRDEKDPEDVNTLSEDHIADETRYRVRSIGRRATQAKTVGAY